MVFSVTVDDELIPQLKFLPKQVPVVIVDEHQQVIPYWYKALEEGLIRGKGNTLIHIDGHSDMATNDDDVNPLMQFKRKSRSPRSAFLPLMQSNDVFITSAIFEGLINKVVWIRPSWTNESDARYMVSAFIGVVSKRFQLANLTGTLVAGERRPKITCWCSEDEDGGSLPLSFRCQYLNRSAVSEREMEVNMPLTACKKVRSYKYIVVGEKEVKSTLKLNKVKSLILDIDEDFFGVESGVGNFIRLYGVTETTQKHIGGILDRLYCPQSVREEDSIDEKIKFFFKDVFTGRRRAEGEKYSRKYWQQKLVTMTSQYFCRSQYNQTELQRVAGTLVTFLYTLSKQEILGLSKLRYCLSSSPKLRSSYVRYGVCHGTISPGDTLNQIYVGDRSEIIKRAESVRSILEFISNHAELKLITVARSLRDGYTPRDQQRYIEKNLIENVAKAIEKTGKSARLVYDTENVFGIHGWRQGTDYL